MFISNFLITLRSLRKNKVYSLINIVGLSAGLAACLLVAVIVIDELSYDKQWTKADRIYRAISVNNQVKGDDRFPLAFTGLGPSLKKDFPEVEDYCRMSVTHDRLKIGANSDGVSLKNLTAEASVWNFLDLQVTEGNPQKFVEGYANLIITEKFKQQYFKGQDPVGKIYYTIPEWGKPQPYLITGVIKELPLNTHLRADVISISRYRTGDDELAKEEYGTFNTQYLLLKAGTDKVKFTQKVNNWYANITAPAKPHYSYQFQPFKDVYLKSDFQEVQPVHGSMRNIYIFTAVAVLLLVIACFNFTTLATSRIFSRMQETGVRKVLGASKGQLMLRYLTESILFFCMALIVAALLYKAFVPFIETYMGHQLVFGIYNASFIVAAIVVVLLVSLLTGIYPAWYLSQPQPITILRNRLPSGNQLNWLKKTLVVGQFVISIGIIIAALVVNNQLNYIDKVDIGFDKNNLLKLEYNSWGNSADRFKQQLKQLPGVESVSFSSWSPGNGAGNMSTEISVPGQSNKITVNYIKGDADLPAVLKVKLKSGRVFSPDLQTDNINGDSLLQLRMDQLTGKKRDEVLDNRPVIITDYTAKLLDVKLNQKNKLVEGVPVGIISDFHNESLHFGLKPCVIRADRSNDGYVLIRLKPNHPSNSLTAINTLLKSTYPEKPFLYEWVGDAVDAQYKNEARLKQLFFCFSVLIVFLSCLGLFGLITFSIQQRVKEIGIRKILGASVTGIVAMLSTDFVKLVVLALLIASPVAGYLMVQWLQDFAYRIPLNWWIFGLAGCIAVLIAVVTISFQTIRAALTNPVKSLRSE